MGWVMGRPELLITVSSPTNAASRIRSTFSGKTGIATGILVALRAEDALEVRVGEEAAGVETVADGEEPVEVGVRGLQILRRAVVPLAPVGEAVQFAHDGFHATEVRVEVDALEYVDGDVRGVA